jgi:hypothetical protein
MKIFYVLLCIPSLLYAVQVTIDNRTEKRIYVYDMRGSELHGDDRKDFFIDPRTSSTVEVPKQGFKVGLRKGNQLSLTQQRPHKGMHYTVICLNNDCKNSLSVQEISGQTAKKHSMGSH